MDRNYGGVIWTYHALQRLNERKIKQGDAWAAWKRPDSSKYDPAKGAWIYRREYDSVEIETVAKKNDKGEWIIVSVWSNPLKSGHKKKTSEWGIIHMIKKFFNLA